MRVPGPVRIGWETLKANAVPMVVLWTMAGSLVVGYYCLPGMRAVLDVLGRSQKSYGVWAGFVSQLFFCGVIPCVFRLLVAGAADGVLLLLDGVRLLASAGGREVSHGLPASDLARESFAELADLDSGGAGDLRLPAGFTSSDSWSCRFVLGSRLAQAGEGGFGLKTILYLGQVPRRLAEGEPVMIL